MSQNLVSNMTCLVPEHLKSLLGAWWKKGVSDFFLTDLCFSWFKMDPACPSYHARSQNTIPKKNAWFSCEKTVNPPFFQIGTLNAHLDRDFPPFWCGPPVAIPPGLSHSFAWLLHADGPPGRARHSTSFIAYGYVRHSGLSFALQPPQSMSGSKINNLR